MSRPMLHLLAFTTLCPGVHSFTLRSWEQARQRDRRKPHAQGEGRPARGAGPALLALRRQHRGDRAPRHPRAASASRRTTRASPRASMRDGGGVPREMHPVRLSSSLRVWLMLLGPAMDLTHNPKARRGWESFGPDRDGYGHPERRRAGRYGLSALVDDRTMHEMYWYPFLRSIEANVSAIMCAYNQLNGTSSCHNAGLLGPMGLVRAAGFQGYVSDWGATHVADNADAGLDMEQPGDWIPIGGSVFGTGGGNLASAVNSGDVSTRIDQMAARVLAPYYWLGQDSGCPPSTSNVTGIVYAGAPGVQTGRGADGPHDRGCPVRRAFMRCAGPATQWGAGLADAMCGMRDEAAYGTTIVYNSLGFPVVRLSTSRPAQGITPHYEFGFGLSYTAFTYSAPKIVSTGSGATSQVVVTSAVANTGGVADGDPADVPRLPPGAGEPRRVLHGFDEVVLAAGASALMSMTIAPREMSAWNAVTQVWVRPAGTFPVTVGASIKDVRLTGTF
ncbi:glycoside hydrolase superfamily [Mycena sp. CBHHK59/15]|nr:glycoside hydrolase superfamily [Mycena sp. CBHHK59/15]